MTIGQVAKRAGVGIETIRFYERQGLLADPPRTSAGYRQYPVDTVARIAFIKNAKELGFSLKEIAELLSLRVHPRRSCGAVMRRAEAKLADIEAKIASLRRMRRALTDLKHACDRNAPTYQCPILNSLDRNDRR